MHFLHQLRWLRTFTLPLVNVVHHADWTAWLLNSGNVGSTLMALSTKSLSAVWET